MILVTALSCVTTTRESGSSRLSEQRCRRASEHAEHDGADKGDRGIVGHGETQVACESHDLPPSIGSLQQSCVALRDATS